MGVPNFLGCQISCGTGFKAVTYPSYPHYSTTIFNRTGKAGTQQGVVDDECSFTLAVTDPGIDPHGVKECPFELNLVLRSTDMIG